MGRGIILPGLVSGGAPTPLSDVFLMARFRRFRSLFPRISLVDSQMLLQRGSVRERFVAIGLVALESKPLVKAFHVQTHVGRIGELLGTFRTLESLAVVNRG